MLLMRLTLLVLYIQIFGRYFKHYNAYFDNMLLIKPITLIPKPHFWTCICQFLMILFLPKFMINVTTLFLKLSISNFR